MGTTSSRQSPDQTLQEICQNLENIEQYIIDHRHELTTNDKRKIEEYLQLFNKQLKKFKNKSQLLFDAFRKLDQLRNELKSIHNPSAPGYTLPKVDDLINLFENNNNNANASFRRTSKKSEKRSSSSSSKKAKVKSSYDILKELNAIEVDIKTKSLTKTEIDSFQKKLIDYAKQLPSRNRSSEVEKIFRTISGLQQQLHEVTPFTPEEELDGGTVETHSFTHHQYPPNLLEIFARLKSDLNLLKTFEIDTVDHLPEAISALEEIERDVKSIKKQLYAQNFKWKRSKSEKLQHILQELEDEINRCDIVAVARQNGKDQASEILRNFSQRISSVESNVSDAIDLKKKELAELVKRVTAFMNDTFVETALAKMEIDHNKFKQQIINFSDSEQSSDYKNFMSYLLQLKKYTSKLISEDPLLRSRKDQIVDDINRSMKILKHKALKFDQVQSGKNTTEKELVVLLKLLKTYSGNIDKISASVRNEEEQINVVEIRQNLEQIRNDILNLNIPQDSVTFARKRQTYLERIDKLLNLPRLQEEVVLRRNRDRLNSLKKKVNKFSGSYQNIYYKTIEKDLHQVLASLHSNEQELRGEILQNLKILEEKSQKDTGYAEDDTRKTLTLVRKKLASVRVSGDDPRRSKNELDFCYDKLDNLLSQDKEIQKEKIELYKEIKEVSSSVSEEIKKKAFEFNTVKKTLPVEKNAGDLQKIRDELETVKARIVTVDGSGAEEFLKIKEGIDKCYGLLSSLKEPSLLEERSSLYKDIGYWSEILNKKYENAESAPAASSNSLEEVFQEVEKKLIATKKEIEAFVGDENSEVYRGLDEALIEMTLQLDKCKFEKGSERFVARRRLMREIQEGSDLLEERLEMCEEIDAIGRGVNVLMIRLDGLSNNLEQENVESLRDELQGLYGKVGEFEKKKRGGGEDELGPLGERCREVLGNLESCKEKLEQLLVD